MKGMKSISTLCLSARSKYGDFGDSGLGWVINIRLNDLVSPATAFFPFLVIN
jgi:hypothetical protein